MQFHPTHQIGFGYCGTHLAPMPDNSSKAARLQAALLRCCVGASHQSASHSQPASLLGVGGGGGDGGARV
jgi:hypothetical protein